MDVCRLLFAGGEAEHDGAAGGPEPADGQAAGGADGRRHPRLPAQRVRHRGRHLRTRVRQGLLQVSRSRQTWLYEVLFEFLSKQTFKNCYFLFIDTLFHCCFVFCYHIYVIPR